MTSLRSQVNLRLSDPAKEMLESLIDRFGGSQGTVVERLIRDEVARLKQTEGFQVGRNLGGRGV
jgi:hypothetical protein